MKNNMSPNAVSNHPKIILVVEDNHHIRKLASQILRRAGYQVIEAANGLEALEVQQQYETTIDLLITDLSMPVMNGVELAQQLQVVTPELKILYISGYTDITTVVHDLNQDEIHLLEKPFTMTSLTQTVHQILTT